MTRRTVIVIGGGASGMLVCANLLRHCRTALNLIVVNSGAEFGKGVAYHPTSDSHLLNVVTGKMSAFADDPDHFVRWLINDHFFSDIDVETLGKTYLPRRIYGEYLDHVWRDILGKKADGLTVEMVSARATGIERTGVGTFRILLSDTRKLDGNYVVLATGNSSPRNPEIPNNSFYQSARYFNNPWIRSSIENLDQDKDVLIIGNGLTMADTVLSLQEKKLKGTIHSVSPHGFGILQHRHPGVPYNGLIRELPSDPDLYQLVSLFNKHIKKARRLGLSAEPIIDSLRPLTQTLWLSFTLAEKKKFINRLRHLWGVARHRLPIHTYDLIQRWKIEGKLKVWAGTIQNLTESKGIVTASIFDKKTKTVQTLEVGRVINCTGPEMDLQKMNDPLFNQMIRSGLIVPDDLNMGLQADPRTLTVIDGNKRPVDSLFALGGLLRGLLWESTAMGEIRGQALQIVKYIVSKENATG